MKYFVLGFLLFTITSFGQYATEESNAKKLKQIQERAKEISIQRTSDSLDEIQKSQYGDPILATQDANSMTINAMIPETAAKLGEDKHIEGSAPAMDLNEIHKPWLEKNKYYVLAGIVIAIVLIASLTNKKQN